MNYYEDHPQAPAAVATATVASSGDDESVVTYVSSSSVVVLPMETKSVDSSTASPVGRPQEKEATPSLTNKQQRIALRAAHKAKQVARDMDQHSQLVSLEKEQALPRLSSDEIRVGQLLGEGAFNLVYSVQEVQLLHPRNDVDASYKLEILASQPTKYAIKCLNQSLLSESSRNYVTGAADLVVEAKLLASLPPHPHVIQLHAIVNSLDGGSFFLVLDLLKSNLQEKMEKWASQRAIHVTLRLRVAAQIAAALLHLHQHRIIYRDVKPTNIGFDEKGCVRLFDMGLAKELTDNLRIQNDYYKLTAMTGSKRYMAPEVALGQPYNLRADVYSFTVLLWEMLALRRIFNMSSQEHMQHVIVGGYRPPISNSFSPMVCQLIGTGWSPSPQERPSMQEVQRMLKGRAA